MNYDPGIPKLASIQESIKNNFEINVILVILNLYFNININRNQGTNI